MVSVVIPAYNEEKKIESVLKGIRKQRPQEIIVVDDGSADRTAKMAAKHAKVLSLKPNQGKGAAMRAGAAMARSENIIFMDADGQFDPEELPAFVKALGKADMVVGVRKFARIPWDRRVTNLLSRLAITMATGRRLEDPLSGFRAVKRSAFMSLDIREKRYAVESEINLKALKRGLRIVEIPVKVRYGGKSSLGPRQSFKITVYLIKNVLKSWLGIPL
jgi:glycosyltransferase involved in cell wall biosynthesis